MVDEERPGSDAGDVDGADELYALPPADFVPARDAAARAARKRGDKDTARRLAALRRPTTSAWLVNLLYRHQREAVEGLLEIGEQLTEASRQLSGPQLQQLSAQRSQVVQALVATARRLASDAGVAVTAATSYEVQNTLGAALADPRTAEEVRSGRLLRPRSYAGFGPEPEATAPQPARRPPTQRRSDGGGDAGISKRRNRARKEVKDAQAAADHAQRQLSDLQAASADARRLCDQLAEDHEALTAQLADLEQRQRQAAKRADSADRACREGADKLSRAQRRLAEASQALTELE